MQGARKRLQRNATGFLLGLALLPAVSCATAADPVLIEIGDRAITQTDLDARFEIAVRLLARRQGVSLADQDPALVESLRQQFLYKRATELVLLEEARRLQVRLSDAQVDVAFGELFGSDEEVEALLADAPLDADQGRALLEQVIREEETVELLTEQILREIKIPPGDVITLHHDAKHLLATPEEVCMRHIQVDDAVVAEKLRAELQHGANFARLAEAHSTDAASAANGGDLGCFERGPAGPRTEFERVAFDADEGEIVGPVESRFGYHVLVVYEHRMPREPTLNEAYAQIERELALEQLPQRIQALVDQSGIELYLDRAQ